MANSVTGLSPQREQQYQERLLLRLSRRYEKLFRAEIKKTMKLLAENYSSVGKQAEILANHGQNIKRLLQSEYKIGFEVFGNRLLDSLIKSDRYRETKREVAPTDLFDREQNLWIIQNGAAKVTQITGTTEKQAMNIINDSVATAVREGLSERQTAKLVQDSMSEVDGMLSRYRSRVISRTELHNAASASQDIAARSSEIPMNKQWVASSGERTRDSHNRANGQIVSMNEPFKVGDEELMYPGDQRGSAEETINCRCVVAYIPR